MESKRSSVSRRQFSKAAVATGIAAPTIIPSSALGLDGAVAPSERVRLAGIGIRNRGSKVLGAMLEQPDVHFVAIADVRADRREAVKKMADDANGDDKCGHVHRYARDARTRRHRCGGDCNRRPLARAGRDQRTASRKGCLL